MLSIRKKTTYLSLKKNKNLITVVLILITCSLKAQFYNLPNDYFYNTLTQKQLAKIDSDQVHAGIQPYIPFFNKKYEFVADTHRVFKFINDDVLINKIFNDHLIHIKSKSAGASTPLSDHRSVSTKFEFKVDPLLNVELGRAYYDTAQFQRVSTNTRGFIASGTIGKDFYFETMFAENQSFFPYYIKKSNNATGVVAGQGRYKVFKTTGYDYAFSSGFISYQPNKKLNIQLGHGKQKVGNGYRSLLLSDNAFNYPYIRITSQWFKGKLQYTNLYSVLMNLNTGGAKTPAFTEPLFQKKAYSMQQLSLNIGKRFNIGLFQGMIWQAADSMNRQHIGWQYVNPIIFTNLVMYGLNNKNNIVIGADVNYKITNSLSAYGQFMADDLSNKTAHSPSYGYQLGAKYFDAFSVKDLLLQVEYNEVKEGAYQTPSGVSNSQAYAHYNQPLAYTLGYGKEIVVLGNYKRNRFFVNAKLNRQYKTLSTYPLYKTLFASAQFGYTINTAYNFNVSLGYTNRSQDFYGFNASNNKTNMFTLSLKSNLYNTYFDF